MEEWKDKNDKMSRWMWKVVEDKGDKAKIVEGEGDGIEKEKI